MLKRIVIITIVIIFCLAVMVQAQQTKVKMPHSAAELECQDCHACKDPTVENPCLRMCPRHWIGKDVGVQLTTRGGPDVIILKELENLYEPVTFTHQAHAFWADLNEGCVTCHHYTPTDASHPPCRECHGPKAVRENIEPNLKGAYHRQCMGCHMDWANDTVCEVCHALKAEKQLVKPATAVPAYRPAKTPDKIVYETRFHKGPFVTFFHEDHSSMYGFSCKDCHAKQQCVACHYQQEKPTAMGGIFKTSKHGKCSICHEVMGQGTCEKCHAETERKVGFNHGKVTGWPLNIYHQKLSCNRCHPADKPIGKLNRNCNSCHSGWGPEKFNHAIVGLELDETHVEFDCSDCHPNRRFDLKPSCADCHDSEITYPANKPGKVTKKGR